MAFHRYLSKAVQDDAQLAAERDRLILMTRWAYTARVSVRVLPLRWGGG
jgi:hypothetical protein